MKKIVICGGHLTPALALIEKLDNKDIEIIFFGRKHATEGSKNCSAEYKIINEKKIKFFEITTGRLQRKFTNHTILSLLKIPLGIVQSFLYLLITRPNMVVSFGSYLSLPVVFSAWLLGIRSVTHEQSAAAGLANKINALFVEKIFISFESSRKYFPADKTTIIGNLIRDSIFNSQTKNVRIKNFLKKKRAILITGGNQGSHVLNRLVLENIKIFKNFNVFHQIGTANFKNDHEQAAKIKAENYMFQDYISSQDIGFVLNSAYIVISRSGANTITDLAALKKPSILIPLPTSAGNEQMLNAQILSGAKSAIILEEENLNQKNLERAILEIEENYDTFAKNAQVLAKIIRLDAAEKLTSFILSKQE